MLNNFQEKVEKKDDEVGEYKRKFKILKIT